MLDDADKAAIAAATRQAIDDATAPLVARIAALEAVPPVDVSALQAETSGNTETLSRVGSTLSKITAVIGEPETAAARNAHVDLVLSKYYGNENDRPPVAKTDG